MSESATVEVLTAEVRVLMVGNRQVTLSVFNQLDRVAMWEEIKPMGRVNPKEGGLWVVGADLAGHLCRYQHDPRPYRTCFENDSTCLDDDWLTTDELSQALSEYSGRFGELLVAREERRLEHEKCRELYQNDVNYWQDVRAAMVVLPLIVLAGLR